MKTCKNALLFALAVLSLGACNNGANKTGSDNKDATVSAESASNDNATKPSGDASFSANVDGDQISGGIIDEMQQINAAYVVQSDAGDELLFFLNDTKSKESGKADKYVFRFAIPKKSGVFNITPEEETWGISLNKFESGEYKISYHSDSVTISINTLSPTRLAGTFSGRFNLAGDTPKETADKYHSTIQIKDGKFDIPFSTGNVVPM